MHSAVYETSALKCVCGTEKEMLQKNKRLVYNYKGMTSMCQVQSAFRCADWPPDDDAVSGDASSSASCSSRRPTLQLAAFT